MRNGFRGICASARAATSRPGCAKIGDQKRYRRVCRQLGLERVPGFGVPDDPDHLGTVLEAVQHEVPAEAVAARR